MIITDRLGKDFRDPKKGVIRAVEEVSIVAEPGKVFGLLGVNGAGKTTFLRMLSTLISPSRGSGSVAGHDIVKNPEAVRSSIGFLSASTALYGRLTGAEVLEYFGGLYGLSGQNLKDRTNFVTRALRLDEFNDQLCDKLSTGQKQRISIARAILHDPPVLFFDEPTAGLDVVTAQTVLEFIETVKGQGKTIVFSTHIMTEAERICDNISIIHQGRVCSQGTFEEIKTQAGEATLERAFLSLVGYEREELAV